MDGPLTWVLLGLAIPQLECPQESLPLQRYHRMDRSADQDPGNVVFVQYADSDLLGPVTVEAVVRAAKVSAVMIATQQSSQTIAGLLSSDSRCSARGDSEFACQLGDASLVNVVVCQKAIVLYTNEVQAEKTFLWHCLQSVVRKSGKGDQPPSAPTHGARKLCDRVAELLPVSLVAWMKINCWPLLVALGVIAFLTVVKIVRARKVRASR